MNSLNPRALEYLDAIACFGSLRKAAVQLSVDPSAISRLLALLEEEVGLPLWERSNQYNRVTMAGKVLLDYYRQTRASEVATLSRIRDLRELRKGEVKIAVGEGFIADLISAPLQNFIAKYSGIEISIEMAGASEAVKLIKDDKVDFGIVYACPEMTDLQCHSDTKQPLNLITPPDHPLVTTGQPIKFKDVCQYPLALIDSAYGMGRLVRLVEELEQIYLTPRLRTNSVAVLINYVTSGLGIAFMPQLTVTEEINTGILRSVAVKQHLMAEARAKLVSHHRRELSLSAEALMNHLQTSMHFLREDAPQI